MSPTAPTRTTAATTAAAQRAAERTASDPVRLGRALRAVRVAFAHGRLTLSDILSPEPGTVEVRVVTPGGDAS